MQTPRLITAAAVLLLLACSVASASAPFSLEELYRRPYLFGTSPGSVSVSDDGRFVAFGWDDTGQSIRDLWVLDRDSGEKQRFTDLWAEFEAKRRREFERDLEKAREAWEKEHGIDEEAESELDEDDMEVETEKHEFEEEQQEEILEEQAHGNMLREEVEFEKEEDEVFDEVERREEFEEELQKQYDSFGGIGACQWRMDSHELFWNYGGKIFSLDMGSAEPSARLRMKHENGWSGVARIRGRSQFLLTSAADIHIWDSISGELTQLTDGGYNEFANTDGYSLSRDGRWLAFSRRDYRGVRQTEIPELYEENPYHITNRYARPQDTPEKVSFHIRDLSGPEPWQFDVEIPDAPHYWIYGIDWSPLEADNRLLLSVVTTDVMGYRVYIVTPDEEGDSATVRLAYSEDDSGWVNGSRTGCGWRSDGSLYLMSEKDGYCRVYELLDNPDWVEPDAEAEESAQAAEEVEEETQAEQSDSDGSDEEAEEAAPATMYIASEIYDAGCEITRWHYLEHNDALVLQLAAPTPAHRQLMLLDIASRQDLPLAGGRNWSELSAVNEDESLLLLNVSSSRRMSELREIDLLPLLAGDGIASETPVRQWTLISRDCDELYDWFDSWNCEIIELPTKSAMEVNGEPGSVASKIFLPGDFDNECSYPLLVYAHGAGYAQNVKDIPQWFDMYFAWLADEKGWIVAVPDFRGSEGYGRDWRIDVKGRLGTPEVEDILVVRDHLVANYGADKSRSGIWGWSYGGFMTLMMLGQAPGEFPVGVAVAPAIDWDNYNYWYSTSRVGKLPGAEDEYEISNASEYLENVTDKLLIMHGLKDNNTLFQTVAQYLEKSHEEGIHVELKLFPRDSHGIQTNFNFIRVFEGVVEYCEDHWD